MYLYCLFVSAANFEPLQVIFRVDLHGALFSLAIDADAVAYVVHLQRREVYTEIIK